MARETGPTTNGFIKGMRLGQGAYGRVYVAESPFDSTNFAVKRIITNSFDQFTHSVRELDMMVQMQGHPFVMKLTWVNFTSPFQTAVSAAPQNSRDDCLWLTMPKARGDLYTLYIQPATRALIKRHFTSVVAQLLSAMEFFQRHRIAHRDLKPENVFVFYEDATPERPNAPDETLYVAIGDLGQSKPLMTVQSCRMTTEVMTPFYRAPEVAVGCQQYTGSIDVWSMGVLIHFILTGQELLKLTNRDVDRNVSVQINQMLPLAEYVTQYPGVLKSHLQKRIPRTPIRQRIRTYYDVQRQEWPPGVSVDDVTALLEQMLVLNQDRPSFSTLLDAPLFASESGWLPGVRTHQLVYENTLFSTVPSAVRGDVVSIYIHIFNERASYRPWYNPRLLFFAMDLVDRCLSQKGLPAYPPLPGYLAGVDATGVDDADPPGAVRHRVHMLAYSCLYIAMKYLLTGTYQITTILPVEYHFQCWIDYLQRLEQYLLCDVFSCLLYRPTLYDIATRHDDFAVRDMLRAVLREHVQYGGKSYETIWNELAPRITEPYDPTTPLNYALES